MGRAYKWLGGIGYILMLILMLIPIPHVSFVALILIAIAWIMMGSDTKQTLFTVTGILMIIAFALSIATVIAIYPTLTGIFAAIPGLISGAAQPPTKVPLTEYLKRTLTPLEPFIAIASATVVAGLASLIAEIASHFRASGTFQNTWFKVGGWLRIVTIIVAVIAIPIIVFFTAMSIPGALKGVLPSMAQVFTLFTNILWSVVIVLILALLATIFSIIAFFTMPEETTA